MTVTITAANSTHALQIRQQIIERDNQMISALVATLTDKTATAETIRTAAVKQLLDGIEDRQRMIKVGAILGVI